MRHWNVLLMANTKEKKSFIHRTYNILFQKLNLSKLKYPQKCTSYTGYCMLLKSQTTCENHDSLLTFCKPLFPLCLWSSVHSFPCYYSSRQLRSGFMHSLYSIYQLAQLPASICWLALCNRGSKYNGESRWLMSFLIPIHSLARSYVIRTEFRFSSQTSCTDE